MSTSTLPVAPATCYFEKKGAKMPHMCRNLLILHMISHVKTNIFGVFTVALMCKTQHGENTNETKSMTTLLI